MKAIEEAASFRLQSLQKEVERLLSIDFPYGDSREALLCIQAVFEKDLENLKKKNTLRNATLSLLNCFIYFPLLGFILRSTNVRNAFEIYGPLKWLCAQFLGEHIGLLLSSEWELFPITYPPSGALHSYVLIGMPASDSANPLLLPLAGHELGHSIWLRNGHRRETSKHWQFVSRETRIFLADSTDWWHRFFPDQKGEQLEISRDNLAEAIEEKALAQAEESFCDFVGLILFGSSYLEAFRWILSPGSGGERNPDYPAHISRARNLERAARRYKIETIPDFVSSFRNDITVPLESPIPKQIDYLGFIVAVADRVHSAALDGLISDVKEITKMSGVVLPSKKERDRISTCFSYAIPASNIRSLGDIINAGWKHHRLIQAGKISQSFDELSDLMLKSIEILEVEIKCATISR